MYAAGDNISESAAENVKMRKSGNVKEKADRLANQINSNRIESILPEQQMRPAAD